MRTYVEAMREQLRKKKIGAKTEFLREILKEVRVRDKAIQLTYKLPTATRTSPSNDQSSPEGKFLSLCNLVEAVGQCKELVCTLSFSL